MNLSRVMASRLLLARRVALAGRSRAAGPVLVVVLGGAIYAGLAPIFRTLGDLGATPHELSLVLGLLFGVALAALLVFDLDHAVSTLLLDRDLDLLRRSPVPRAAILALKLADALPRTLAPLAVLALPALLAWGGATGATPAIWLVALPALACLWAIPIGLGLAIAIAVLDRLPPHRARLGLNLLSTLTVAALWLANLLFVPRLAGATGDPLVALRAWLAGAGPLLSASPASWAAAAIEGARAGDGVAAVRAGAPLVGLALAAGALAWWSVGRRLDAVLAAVRHSAAGPRPGRTRARAAHPGRRPGFVRLVVARDLRLIARDWTVLSDVVTAAVLWTLLPLAGTALHVVRAPALVRAMLVTLSVGLGYEIAARAIPVERLGAAWMRLAPVTPGRWVLAKLASAAALALPLVLVAGLTLGIARGLAAGEWLEVAIGVAPALFLSISLGLWTGAAFGDPGWTNPRAMLPLGGRMVAAALLVAQIGAWLVLIVIEEYSRANRPPWPGFPWPLAAGSVLALLPIRALWRHLSTPGH